MEAETGYHATMMCTKAKELRQDRAKDWKLPSEVGRTFTGDDWVLVLLDKVPPEMRDKLMFIWRRSWNHRNDIIFGKGDSSIVNSSRFLQNYLCTLHGSAKGNVVKDRKGKSLAANWVVKSDVSSLREKVKEEYRRKPEIGWVKYNVDASFLLEEKKGSWGAIIQDHNVAVLGSSWNIILTVKQLQWVRPSLACRD
jgi:hypothetical protein